MFPDAVCTGWNPVPVAWDPGEDMIRYSGSDPDFLDYRCSVLDSNRDLKESRGQRRKQVSVGCLCSVSAFPKQLDLGMICKTICRLRDEQSPVICGSKSREDKTKPLITPRRYPVFSPAKYCRSILLC